LRFAPISAFCFLNFCLSDDPRSSVHPRTKHSRKTSKQTVVKNRHYQMKGWWAIWELAFGRRLEAGHLPAPERQRFEKDQPDRRVAAWFRSKRTAGK